MCEQWLTHLHEASCSQQCSFLAAARQSAGVRMASDMQTGLRLKIFPRACTGQCRPESFERVIADSEAEVRRRMTKAAARGVFPIEFIHA